MRRRYKKTRLRPKPFLVLALAGNLVAGFLASPITSVHRLRVDGASPDDQARILRLAQSLRSVPCARVNPRAFESAVLAAPDVRSAALSRSIFGSAVLTVAYRRPVAQIYSGGGMSLTHDGVLYPAGTLVNGVPLVRFVRGAPGPSLTLASNWRAVDIARLAERAREIDPKRTLRIDVEPGGIVCLNIDGGRVVLGSCDNLDEKLRVLSDRLSAKPDLLSTVDSLVLTNPSNPAFVPKKVEPIN